MPKDYTVSVRISVSGGNQEPMLTVEETSYQNLTFAKMTKISSDYYDLIAKLDKEKKSP